MDIGESSANIGRRAFLAGGAGMLLSGVVSGDEKTAELNFRPSTRLEARRCNGLRGFKPIELRRLSIRVCAERPFGAVHISDTHIVRADATEGDPRKVELSARRYIDMGFGEHYLAEAVAEARRANAILLHTGDMIDFVSNANLSLAERYFGSCDCFASAGNHEFSKYVGEAKEDAAYKADSFARVSASFPNDLAFASRVVNGVNFVAFDNVYYNVSEDALMRMENEVAKGLPMVLMCHVPFYTPRHYENEMSKTGGVCAFEMGVPDDLVSIWKPPVPPLVAEENWRDRRVQQKADATTKEFVRYVKAQPLVKAVLCGHCHGFWQERFSASAVQYVCSATFLGEGYAIEFT